MYCVLISPDFSVMSSDCIHFSGRGLSLLHIYIWNWLVQPSKRQPWVPLVRRLYCPRPACPFFATEENIHSCPYRWQSADGRNRKKVCAMWQPYLQFNRKHSYIQYVRGELTSGRGQIDSRDLWYFNHVMVIACIAFYFTIFLCLLCCRIRKRRYNG